MFATSFEQEEKSFKNRKTSLAAFVTIALHALILLFLIWSILTPPDPPYTDSAGGVTVNFGNVDEGSGAEQPMTLTPIQADFTSNETSAPAETSPVEEDVATQDMEDAPVIENNKTELKRNTTKSPTSENNNSKAKEPSPPPAPQPDQNALFHKGAGGKPNHSNGDGTGKQPGDQGKLSGDPNSKSYLDSEGGKGSGPGRGDLRGGVSLKGRKSTALPPPTFCNATGNVIIDITVDRNGKVVDAKYHRDGSTITDACSIQNAKAAALKSKFNSDTSADEYQYGSINYVFTVQ